MSGDKQAAKEGIFPAIRYAVAAKKAGKNAAHGQLRAQAVTTRPPARRLLQAPRQPRVEASQTAFEHANFFPA